jgi:uncharacterized protein involved in cysteine biosynthesis
MEDFIKQIIQWTGLSWVIYNQTEKVVEFIMNKWNINLSFLLCPKCFTFWLTLLLTFDPFISSITSLNNYLIDKYINNKKTIL